MDPRADRILRLRQAGETPPADLVLDALELVGPAQARIGFERGNRAVAENLPDLQPIPQGDLLEPIHQIAKMIFADLERDG